MLPNRYSVKFGGESGQGINTLGKILSQALKDLGLNIFAYREYPSLIKGGIASYQIDFSNDPIRSSSTHVNVLAILDQEALDEYKEDLLENGTLLCDEKIIIEKVTPNTLKVNTKQIIEQLQAKDIMANMIILGTVWKTLGLPLEELKITISEIFKNKTEDIVLMNHKCLEAGYNIPQNSNISLPQTPNKNTRYIMTGNDALALGAISSGVRAYYGYPMTPATSIFKYLGSTYKETGILIKQAENEITAVQMALGSMAMGTRALTATSGGGFDLMQETISCAGISETPLVIVLAQRIGAGTGVPTWTGAGDLTTAVKGGHGEFPRLVISVSDIESAYTNIQHAFNLAEEYQIPVIVLTEKQIAESLFTIDKLPEKIQITRGFSDSTNRYEITENGISPRSIPQEGKSTYIQTSDEHDQEGLSTENMEMVQKMSNKRMMKLKTLTLNTPEPKIYGDINSEIVFVGWGNVKNPILDTMMINNKFAYLHYEYMYPLKTETLRKLIDQGKNLVLIENNQTAELGKLIKETIGYEFPSKYLRYDGRPFFVEDIIDILNKQL